MLRLAIVLGFAVAAFACKPAPANDPGSDAAIESAPDARVARLCGTWRAEGPEGSAIEERWRASDEGLAGEGVTTDAEGSVVSSETLLILLDGEGSTYRAHPQGAAGPTDFEQTTDQAGEAAEQWIWSWHNPEHDFPQTVRYVFTGTDRMEASVSGPDGEGGTREFGSMFERVAACPK
jgi:hypothetical protein